MPERKLPYAQALKLQGYVLVLQTSEDLCLRLEQFVQRVRAQVDRQKQKLSDVVEFEGIPLDKPVDVRMEDGPIRGMIRVVWEDKKKDASA